ncbi:MAG: hypothetical protein WCG34_05360, partial [Leptolinea sp.]
PTIYMPSANYPMRWKEIKRIFTRGYFATLATVVSGINHKKKRGGCHLPLSLCCRGAMRVTPTSKLSISTR